MIKNKIGYYKHIAKRQCDSFIETKTCLLFISFCPLHIKFKLYVGNVQCLKSLTILTKSYKNKMNASKMANNKQAQSIITPGLDFYLLIQLSAINIDNPCYTLQQFWKHTRKLFSIKISAFDTVIPLCWGVKALLIASKSLNASGDETNQHFAFLLLHSNYKTVNCKDIVHIVYSYHVV